MKPSDVDVPDGWGHAGWVDEYGNLWSLLLRRDVESDRPVFAPPLPNRFRGERGSTCDE